jgi:dTDP-4-dehydrorhamnose 3,5-epimerase-like enzyme
LQYLPALAPGFAQYLSLEDATPQVCMWVSSPNVTAALHYDLEDNFLLQISGTKTVVLVSPEALPALRPHTSWYPHWRQVANSSELHTSAQIIDYLHAFADAFGAAAVESRNDSRSQSRLRTFSAYGEMKVYELTLQPGSMVHIPAGFYHTIVAGDDSLTVNAWFPSDLSALYTQITNIALPFNKANTMSTKINNLTVLMRKLLYRLESVGLSIELFAGSFSDRFVDLIASSSDQLAVEWEVYDVELLCAPSEIKVIGECRSVVSIVLFFMFKIQYIS